MTNMQPRAPARLTCHSSDIFGPNPPAPHACHPPHVLAASRCLSYDKLATPTSPPSLNVPLPSVTFESSSATLRQALFPLRHHARPMAAIADIPASCLDNHQPTRCPLDKLKLPQPPARVNHSPLAPAHTRHRQARSSATARHADLLRCPLDKLKLPGAL
jgi:hypothetical protein